MVIPLNIDTPVGWVAAALTVIWLAAAVITIALRDPDEKGPRSRD